MGIFSSIKNAIFGKSDEEKAAEQAEAAAAEAAAQPLDLVDVFAKLEAMPGSDGLNWRTSIVDLMKLIGLDASYGERKELATELGRQDYSGTAEDNIWLHKAVMKGLAENGGVVPDEFRD